MFATKSLIDICADRIAPRSFKSVYENTFALTRCDTPEQQGKAFRLRHRVLCQEYGFECPTEEGSFIEADEFDERAVHFVLCHQLSNEVAGTVRVVLPNDEKPGESFPVQQVCDHPLLGMDARMTSFCEISRFCMAPRFRQRGNDGRFLSGYQVQDPEQGGSVRRQIAYPQAALLQGAFETAMEAGILDCIWMVEPEHLESLTHIGFPYRSLGPQIDHHGGVQPIIFNIKHVLDNMRRDVPACWEIVSDEGRLQDMADELLHHHWCDTMMDEKCRELIYRKLTS